MRSLGTFLYLAARPATMFFLPALLLTGWGVATIMSRGFAELGVDPVIVDAFVFPALLGLLAGQLMHELQHCPFTWTLPSVARRTLIGFSATGTALALLMAAILNAHPHPAMAVFAVALAGYCLGSLFVDPLGETPLLTVALALLVLFFSGTLGEQALMRPAAVVAGAGVVCGLCLWRTFSRESFRRKPFRPTKTLATGFSPTASARYRREEIAESGPSHRGWGGAYLGTDLGRWMRAAAYEVYGPLGWKRLGRSLGFLLPLGLITGLHAKIEAGDGSFLQTLWKTLYHAFMRPPDMPSFSEKGEPHLLIVLIVCAAGVALAMSLPVALTPGRLYPLSRRDLGRLAYRNQLVSVAAYGLVTALFYGGVGLAAGHLAGYEPRFDFVPLWMRALLWTLALMPVGQWFHLRTRTAQRGQDSGTIVGQAFLTILSCVVVSVVTLLLALAWPSSMELAVVAVAIAGGQLMLRRRVRRHFATADLV